jgi:hypothetical protein
MSFERSIQVSPQGRVGKSIQRSSKPSFYGEAMESLLLFHRDAESVKSHPQSSMSENDKSLESESQGFYQTGLFQTELKGKESISHGWFKAISRTFARFDFSTRQQVS